MGRIVEESRPTLNATELKRDGSPHACRGRMRAGGGCVPGADACRGPMRAGGRCVPGADACLGRMRAGGGCVPGADGCLGRMRAWGGCVPGADACRGRMGAWGIAQRCPSKATPSAALAAIRFVADPTTDSAPRPARRLPATVQTRGSGSGTSHGEPPTARRRPAAGGSGAFQWRLRPVERHGPARLLGPATRLPATNRSPRRSPAPEPGHVARRRPGARGWVRGNRLPSRNWTIARGRRKRRPGRKWSGSRRQAASRQ
jgi:hypothetical protein